FRLEEFRILRGVPCTPAQVLPRGMKTTGAPLRLTWAALAVCGVASGHLGTGTGHHDGHEIWLTALLPFTGGEWDVGISARVGGEIMLDEINQHPHLLPGYELKVVWQDGMCDDSVATPLFIQNVFEQKYTAFAAG
ncbi:unnamed protein product, partial [Prorocentrum cordatum]